MKKVLKGGSFPIADNRVSIPSRKRENSFAKEQLGWVRQVCKSSRRLHFRSLSDCSCSTCTSNGLSLAVSLSKALGQEWTCVATRVVLEVAASRTYCLVSRLVFLSLWHGVESGDLALCSAFNLYHPLTPIGGSSSPFIFITRNEIDLSTLSLFLFN